MNKALRKRNCRDLSYLVNEEGLRLKPGLFFRSGHLFKLKKSQRKALEAMKLKTIVDLRTDGEITKKPDEAFLEAKNIAIPVLEAETLGITHERGLKAYKKPPHMPELYHDIIVNKKAEGKLSKALRILLSLDEGPRLWHCTAGKDRAGILSALFLLALGYKEEDVLADYELSDKPNRKKGRLYRFLILVFLWKKELAQGVYLAMCARREYLLSAFAAMKEVAGSVPSFIHDILGIDEGAISSFKKKFMTPALAD